MSTGLGSFQRMLFLSTIVVFLLYPERSLSTDRYTWYLFPSANDRLYGYQPQTNQSFASELLPSGLYVTEEESVNGLWVPPGEKVNLGDFSAGCLADVGVCENFTVSFLFKINGSIPENETVNIIHQIPLTDAENRVLFSVSQNNSHYTAVAIVARGVNKTEVPGVISITESWIHAAIIYSGPGYLELFLNGTNDGPRASLNHYNGSVSQLNMTLGSSNSSNGFFVSYLQVFKDAIQAADINSLKDESFAQAINPNRTTVTVSQSSRKFDESDGTVTIFIEREGNLKIVSFVMYTLSEGSATNSSDFTFDDSPNGQLIFKPGEITKSVSVNIINNTLPEMNETLLLNLTSLDGITNITDGTVEILILDNDIDDCSPDPCEHGGTCIDQVNDYMCTCAAGYTGKNCSVDIDDCAVNPCQNSGTCNDQVNDYNCTCAPGFTGKNCSINIDDCSPDPCEHGGTCIDQVNDYMCTCVAGYTGKNCSVDIDDCAVNPCQNSGTCNDQVNDYNCTCAPGFTGKNCSINIDDCANGPCQNNGTCTDLLLDYNCTCTPGYTGKNCTLDTYLWYLFPAGANRVYGYEPNSNLSFESDELSPGTKVAIKNYTHSIHVPQANELILGDFANPCFKNATVCSSFSISFLVFISGSVPLAQNVYILESNSSFRGSYHVRFFVKRSSARLEGHAFVVGGNSSKLIQRKIAFPATDDWVHVVIVYSVPDSLELYVNSVKVTGGDAIIPTDWISDSSVVHVSLGSKQNLHDIFVSYLQIIKGTLTQEEVSQLEKESREQAISPAMATLELTHRNIAESEGALINVPLLRSGNLAISSVVHFSIKDGTASAGEDFAVPSNDEVVIRPGEISGGILVNISDDIVPEVNETLSVTISTSDNVTIFSKTNVNITIINNDIDDCVSNPCVNGGTCIDLELDFLCNCPVGYTGKNCSIDIDDCSPYPCEHGGTCIDQFNDYMCTCVAGYTGKNCSVDIDDCAVNPCQNSGTCNDQVNDYNCTCAPGFTGRNCTKESYFWYLFPSGADRVYGYDTAYNRSFNSDLLPANAIVTHKDGFRGLCIPAATQVNLGDFADQCLRSTCDSFAISFLTYVTGTVAQDEDVQILYSTPKSRGLYHVQFTVTQTVSRLEGLASIVGGNSLNQLERKGTFPGVNKWVHVAIVYSKSSHELNLYFDSVKVTDPNSTVNWINNGEGVNISLAYTGNARETCVSYFQIISDVVTELEIKQLEEECRRQAAHPSMVDVNFSQNNFDVKEDVGTFTVPVMRYGNTLITSVLQFSSSDGDAAFNNDFNVHQLNQEVVVKPGELHSGISVSIANDSLPENNETFHMTVTSSDNVTTITGGSTTITIQDDDIDECAPMPCENGATCTDDLLDYRCTCVLGFTGKNCSQNINDCVGDPCQNNGSCNDLVNDYRCSCSPGYTGKNCSDEINECDSSPCMNGATCEDLLADYNCTCAPGFTGRNCSEDIDECSANPCKNNGQCTNKPNDFSCTCSEGFTGKDCSTILASTGEDDKNLLRILFWACIGALVVSLLALFIAAIYFCRKLKGAAQVRKRRGSRKGYTSYNGASTL